jgi:cytoskeletal protein RodZ
VNRLGRVFFVLLCIVALALLVLVVLVFAGIGVKDKSSSPPTARKGTGGETVAYAPTTTAPPKTQSPPSKKTTTSPSQPAPQTPPQVSPVVLVVTASRGDCWLEVRRGSETGPVRYAATLPLGQTVRFQGARFWVRFGGASNVDVLFGGKPVSVPSGTVALVLSRPSRL